MDIHGMEHFQTVCRNAIVDWYTDNIKPIGYIDTYVVWSCKILKNYKCMVSTSVYGDGVYAEYTYNGNTGEIYEDVYRKVSNRVL